MQTRNQSRLEVAVDFVLSLMVNVVAQWLVYGALATASRSLTFAALVLGLAVPRRYLIRRVFNGLLPPGARQSRRHSGLEVGVDTLIAIVVAVALQWLMYGAAATWAKAGGLTLLVYGLTMGRRYMLRRLFETWSARQEPAPYGQNLSPEALS